MKLFNCHREFSKGKSKVIKTQNLTLLALASLLLFTGCDPERKPLEGKRVPVVSYETTVKVDSDTKDQTVLLPLIETGRDWPQTGGSPNHGTPNLALNDKFKSLWSTSIGSGAGAGRFLSTPVVAEGVIYSMDTYGQVTAHQISSGERLWATDIAPEGRDSAIIGGGLAYGNGKVYVTSPHAEVLALDATSGEILWRRSTPSPVRAAPTLAEGRLFILSISNQLDVLNADSGDLLWNHAGITEHAGLLGTASPAVQNGVVVVPYSSGEIYALKTVNGHQLWTETLNTTRRPDSLSSLSHIRALPVIDQGKVIIIGHNQKMAAYDLRRGERLWDRAIGGTRTPAVLGGYIFMINSHNELLGITRDYGQVAWIQKLPSDSANPTKVLWNGPFVAGNKLYITSTQGELWSIDPATGKKESTYHVKAPVSVSPLVAQETLFILTDEGDLRAYK